MKNTGVKKDEQRNVVRKRIFEGENKKIKEEQIKEKTETE